MDPIKDDDNQNQNPVSGDQTTGQGPVQGPAASDMPGVTTPPVPTDVPEGGEETTSEETPASTNEQPAA